MMRTLLLVVAFKLPCVSPAASLDLRVPALEHRYTLQDDGFEDFVPVKGLRGVANLERAWVKIRGTSQPFRVRCENRGEDTNDWPVLCIAGRIQGRYFSKAVTLGGQSFEMMVQLRADRGLWDDRDDVLKVWFYPGSGTQHPTCWHTSAVADFVIKEFELRLEPGE